MSRTDVHRPPWVKEKDEHDRRHFVESHSHLIRSEWDPKSRRWLVQREAPCDLHAYLDAKGPTRHRCGLTYIGGRNIYCGCKMCTGQVDRRLERRRERYEARRQIARED